MLFRSKQSKDEYFSLYALGEDYHIVVKDYLEEIACVIRSKGYKAKIFVDNNPLPERYLAYASGVGGIGKNSMLITKTYGSYVFLGEIITNYHIKPTEKKNLSLNDHKICGSCNLCVKACPADILKRSIYDTKECLSFITQKKELEENEVKKLKGRLFGCDTCQTICPLNKGVEKSNIKRFKPKEYMVSPSAKEILCINNKEFKKYKETASAWRGKKLLQRNALVYIKEKKLDIDKKCINTDYLQKYDKLLDEIYK